MILDAAAGSRPAHPAPARKESEYPIPEMVETCLALNLNIYIYNTYIYMYIHICYMCTPRFQGNNQWRFFSVFLSETRKTPGWSPGDLSAAPFGRRHATVATATSLRRRDCCDVLVTDARCAPWTCGGICSGARWLGWSCWRVGGVAGNKMGIYGNICTYIYIYTDLFLW